MERIGYLRFKLAADGSGGSRFLASASDTLLEQLYPDRLPVRMQPMKDIRSVFVLALAFPREAVQVIHSSMVDFEAPSGPPPPRVPEGWVARWNDQYKECKRIAADISLPCRFYVNTYTKKSQWDKPTAPAINPNDDSPAGPPPGYTPGGGHTPSDVKTNPFAADSQRTGGSSHQESEDERLARQLQEEENARGAGSSSGAASSYLNSPAPPQSHSPYPDQLPARPGDVRGSSAGGGGDKAKGFLGKLFGSGKNKMSGGGYGGGGYGGQQQQYGSYGSPAPQQGYYNGPPPQQGYYPPQQQGGYYGGPQQGYGGYPQQGGNYGRPQKSGGGGMGMMGGAALGLGAGVLGGALIEHEIDESQQDAYQDGYNDGNDGGDYGGGDDFGGGDF
ncbi:WW domain-containing protein [Seiridium cupressi]